MREISKSICNESFWGQAEEAPDAFENEEELCEEVGD